MRFELRDRQVVLRPTFRTADPHCVLKHIHLPKRQGGSMGPHTSLKRRESIRLRRVRFRHGGIPCRYLPGHSIGGHPVHHAARTACQHHNALRLNTLDRQTERVHRPTLLEKGSAADNLCHRPPSYPGISRCRAFPARLAIHAPGSPTLTRAPKGLPSPTHQSDMGAHKNRALPTMHGPAPRCATVAPCRRIHGRESTR
jgi:hypothetical protein